MCATLESRAGVGCSAVGCWAGATPPAHPLEVAYHQYGPKLYHYLLGRTRDPDVAQDLLSSTFERALRGFDTYEDRGFPISAWLYRIAATKAANWHREQRRRPTVPLEAWCPAADNVCEAAIRTVESEHVRRAIGQLRPIWRVVLTLRFLEDRALPDVAARLGVSVGAVKARQHRALVALRVVLEDG